jgi:hypothetical protein
MLIKIALNECIISMFKKCFKENHLDEMNREEWESYIKHKADTGIQNVTDFLDLMYGNYFIVTREELSSATDKNIHEFYNLIREVFDNGKEIQLKNIKKIESLESQLEEEINKLVKT